MIALILLVKPSGNGLRYSPNILFNIKTATFIQRISILFFHKLGLVSPPSGGTEGAQYTTKTLMGSKNFSSPSSSRAGYDPA